MTVVTGDIESHALSIADAAQESWRVVGYRADVLKWDDAARQLGAEAGAPIRFTVVVPEMKQIECVIDSNAELPDAWSALSGLRSGGWIVRAILPVSSMGQAHEALRGLDISLQGWWRAGENALRFTSPEVP